MATSRILDRFNHTLVFTKATMLDFFPMTRVYSSQALHCTTVSILGPEALNKRAGNG